jgi:chromatin remodeling complex protein RSC6
MCSLLSGGDFPFLAAADDINLHIQVHFNTLNDRINQFSQGQSSEANEDNSQSDNKNSSATDNNADNQANESTEASIGKCKENKSAEGKANSHQQEPHNLFPSD